MQIPTKQYQGPSRWGWAFLLLVLVTAVFLRFWQVGAAPPGLYHDEAYNGLDAARVLVEGPSLYFAANNGREPAYIWLTALAVAAVGQTALAVRLAAAVVGSLTLIPVYLLAKSWFDVRVGLFAAWLWAITLWPVHLSRIGLRAILLVPLLALTFWLGTLAFRRQKSWLWLLAGAAYGLSFYTYLAARFTPLLLALLLLFLLWRGVDKRLWPGVVWFGLATAVVLLPLALFFWQNPDLLLGRTGQVSILSPAINGGDVWGTLWRQTGAALGMFLWRGDAILRHNPAGRPVFDLFMAAPFLIGLGWCVWHWRRMAAAALLLWLGVMLWPTILAEDAPHFLRAVGVLPAALLLPALGLGWLWSWGRLATWLRQALVVALLGGSLLLTVRDYVNYSQQAEVAYLFETAVTDLAVMINQEKGETAVFLDEERFWKKYPTLRFLAPAERIHLFQPESGLPLDITTEMAIYAWPFAEPVFMEPLLTPPLLISVQEGSLARGDLEVEAYPLFVRYGLIPAATMPPLADFGDEVSLYKFEVNESETGKVQVELVWGAQTAVPTDRVRFIHLVGPDGLIAQVDGPPGQGYWRSEWWQPGLFLQESYTLPLPATAVSSGYQLHIGWYEGGALARLPVTAANGDPLGDAWIWPDQSASE